MQIDSTKVHELLNAIAIECSKRETADPVALLKEIRNAMIAIEADAACNKARESEGFKALRDHNDKILFLLGQATMFLMELDQSLELPTYQKERIKNLVREVGRVCYGELQKYD